VKLDSTFHAILAGSVPFEQSHLTITGEVINIYTFQGYHFAGLSGVIVLGKSSFETSISKHLLHYFLTSMTVWMDIHIGNWFGRLGVDRVLVRFSTTSVCLTAAGPFQGTLDAAGWTLVNR
jgi:hypothetical protein